MIAPVLLSTLLGAAEIKKDNIFHDQGHSITHGKGGFRVNDQQVSNDDLSPELRGISRNSLKSIFATGKALRVSRIGNNYGLDTQSRIKGGGPIGAWLGGWIGYGSVMTGAKILAAVIAYPVIIVCPPAGAVVGFAADTVLGVVAQPIAITAAVGGAIAGGTITGPV